MDDFKEDKNISQMQEEVKTGIRSCSRIVNSKLLFIDIETVREFPTLKDGGPKLRAAWEYKNRKELKELERTNGKKLTKTQIDKILSESYLSDAALYAEFNQVVCISIGFYNQKTEELRIKSFYGRNEETILQEFSDFAINDKYASEAIFVGHSIKGFDIPVLCRRMVKYQIRIPPNLDMTSLKPWEVMHLHDISMEWRFNSWYAASLSDMCYILGIDTPKDEMKGSEVSDVYHQKTEENKADPLNDIVTYCEKDVKATAELFYIMAYKPINKSK